MSGIKGFLDQFSKPIPDPTPQPEPIPVPEPTPEPIPEPIPEPSNEPSPEPSPEPQPNSDPTPEPTPEPQPEPTNIDSLNDDMVKQYFKSKHGQDVESFDELFKNPEAVVDPLEGISDEALQFLKYTKETGRDLNDWNSLNKDFSKVSPLDAARQKVAEMTDGELKGEEIDRFLEKKLNIDLSDPSDLEKFDAIEIKAFGKDFIANKIKEQQTYKQPIEPKASADMHILENGTQIPKAQYDLMGQQRQDYVNTIKSSADKIKSFDFKVKIDNNGVEQNYDLEYEYSKEDKHNMLTSALDIDQTVSKLFKSKDGSFNHAQLTESMNWLDPTFRGKMISSLIQKGIAKNTEELMRKEQNIKLGQKNIPAQQSNKKIVPLPQSQQKGVVNTAIFNQKP